MGKKLKGKPGENRRRKATELRRYPQRNVSGAARFDRQDWLICSFLIEIIRFKMKVNIKTVITCLHARNSGDLQSALSLVFPLVDKAARELYPTLSTNKERMVAFLNHVFNNIYLLRYSPNTYPIQNGNIIFNSAEGKSAGEILYDLRCQLIHQAECAFDIRFSDDVQFACYEDDLSRTFYEFGTDLAEMLMLAVLIYVPRVKFQNADSAIISIGAIDLPLGKILANPREFKSILHNRKYSNLNRTPTGVVTTKLKNSKVGKGEISNNG